jgi:hypothetical protein
MNVPISALTWWSLRGWPVAGSMADKRWAAATDFNKGKIEK